MDSLSQISGIPAYVQIREALREEITSGRLTPGERIPPEKTLAERHGVSRMTLRHGLADLIREGLLVRRRGVGTFVARQPIDRDYSRLVSSFEQLLLRGLVPTSRVLSLTLVPAEPKVAQALNLPDGAPVIRLERVRVASGQPIAILTSYLPQSVAPQLLQTDMEANPSLSRMMESWGYTYKRALQHIEGRTATPQQAHLLEISPGSAVVHVERINYNGDGQPLEYVEVQNRADIYRASMVLIR